VKLEIVVRRVGHGGACSIGRAIADALMEAAANVLLVNRDGERARDSVEEIGAAARVTDLATDGSPESAAERALSLGRLDFFSSCPRH
jgi:NAD(P)-dependent dehydrogenase (short-subunit alcohol dehydrogenase family)